MNHGSTFQKPSYADTSRRPGVVMVFTLTLATVLVGFAALTIDVGMMYGIKAELQRTADAAALAGVQDLRDADPSTVEVARHTVGEYVARNTLLNDQPALFDPERNAVFGRATVDELEGRVDFTPGAAPPNAVRVTVAYDMDYMFAGIFGLSHKVIRATALAAVTAPRTVDVVPIALPAPGFGPVDPDIAEQNPGKAGPSEPGDGERFQPGEEVAVYFFGRGPRQPVHLVIDVTDSNGVADLNRLLATEESLGGTREPVDVSIGDEYYVWGEGSGNGNFGEKLETRINDYDTANNTVIMPIVDTLEDTRNADGRLENKVRVVDFVAVTLTEIREEEVVDPRNPDATMTIRVMYGIVGETVAGWGDGSGTTSGTYTAGSVKTSPQLLM